MDNQIVGKSKKLKRAFPFILIAVFAVCYLLFTWFQFEKGQSEEVLQIARTIGNTIPFEEILQLEADPKDSLNPNYQHFRNALKEIITVNNKVRTTYIHFYKDGKIYNLVNSEPEDSPLYLKPGEEVIGLSENVHQPFKDGKERIIHPTKDKWGDRICALIPIKDKKTGEIIALFGIDFNIKNLNKILIIEVIESSILIFLTLFALVLFIKTRHNYKTLKEDNIQRKKSENDLIIAKLKAEESDKLKSAFLANMSHEIRTPMNGILGFAELLSQPKLTGKERKEYIRIIEKSGKRMLNIINDIVDISKIESGNIEIHLSNTNINEKIDFIHAFFKPETELKGIHFSCKKDLAPKDAYIVTDAEKLYIILTNLIKNAIKYTISGSIEFGYSEKQNYLEFYVKDTGIGIPSDRHEAIFERFIQADIEDKQAFQGAGLGLTISKAYVELLGGKIWVESDINGFEGVKGSSFYFTIPTRSNIKIKNADLNEIVEIEEINNLKILIVDDDETSRILISNAINNQSNEILSASSGLEAIEKCQNNPDIDVILMDIKMSGMDGYETTGKIRQFNKNVIIIAQTAHALRDDRQKAIDSGCNDYVSKPLHIGELIRLIKMHKNLNVNI
jgi:signal transduction histidine kinase/CheY-like chemotaxis protein